MKRFLSLMLCMVMLVSVLGVTASAGSYDIVSGEPAYLEPSETGKIYDGAAWANYYFACGEKGIYIFNINTEAQIAHWQFTEAATNLKEGYNVPHRIAVNDKYIAVLMGLGKTHSVVVFENPAVYTNTVPELMGTFGYLDGANPHLFMDGENIWVTELRESPKPELMGQSEWTAPPRAVVCWNINLEKFEALGDLTSYYDEQYTDFGKFIELSNAVLYEEGATNAVVADRHDFLWAEAEFDGTYLYYTTYNDLISTPSKTLETHRIDLLNMTYDHNESHTVAVDLKSGMSIQFETENRNMTLADLRVALKDLAIYEYGNTPNEEDAKLGDFSDEIMTIQIGSLRATEDKEARYLVNITISDLGAIVDKVKFNDPSAATVDELKRGPEGECRIVYAYEGNEYEFSYSQAVANFQSGAMAVKDGMVYVFTCVYDRWSEESLERTRMYILQSEEEGLSKAADYQIYPMNARGNVISATTAGNTLFGVISGIHQNAYFLDISNSPDMDMNVPEMIKTNAAGNPSTEGFKANLHHGRRIFYTSTVGSNALPGTINQLETVGGGLTIESASDFTEKAVYLYGFSKDEDGVKVSVDGIEREVSSYGGVWALAVENIANGTHTVTVTEEGEEASAEFTTYSEAMEEKAEEVSVAVNGCADGEALVTYLDSNPDAAQLLGINTAGNYSQLDADVKEEIMDEVLPLLKSGDATAIAVFEEKVADEYKAKLEKEALQAVNGADKDTIGGIFEEYKDVLFADEEGEEIWEDYLKNKGKKSKIHKYFVGYDDCGDIDEVAENLKKAIDKANETTGGGGNDGGGRDDKKESIDVGYTAPKEPVEIYEPIQPKAFNDVANDFWGYEAITTLATRGIIDGVGGGNFAPETTVTREAFVKMLVEALGLKANGNGKAFSDVDANAWYAEYVNIASSIGLVEGYDGKFGIGESLTREQMATMLYRAANLANIKLENKVDAKDFTDSEEIGEYAVEAVNALYQAGIVNGMADGSYAPKTVCTRAMAAKVIYEILAIK